jgi:hypothetical protein
MKRNTLINNMCKKKAESLVSNSIGQRPMKQYETKHTHQ